MDLFKNLLGDTSCGADGTVSSSNPINAVVDRLFDTTGMSGTMGQLPMSEGGVMEGGAGITYIDHQQQQQPNMEMNHAAFHDMQSMQSMQNVQGMDPSMNTMDPNQMNQMQAVWDSGGGGGGAATSMMPMGGAMGMQMQMQQMAQMAYIQQMQQQQYMQQMMQQEQYHQQQQQQQQQQYEQEQAQYEQQQLEEEAQLNETYSTVDEPVTSQSIEEALQNALDQEGDLGVERLEDIWEQFQQKNSDMAATETETMMNEGASKSDTDSAWANLQDNIDQLSTDQSISYDFASQNKFLSAQQAATAAAAAQDALHHESLQDLFDEAMRMYTEGNIADALLMFEANVQMHTDHDESWRMLGRCHAENDMDKAAIVCLKRALDIDPYNLDALLALGTSYVNELDSAGALHMLKEWVLHHPTFCGLTPAQDEYSDGTLMDEVMQLILAAHSHAPMDVDVKVLLGVLYNVSQNFDQAASLFNEALQARPDDFTLLNKLGATLANSNESTEAIPLYEKALGFRPSYARGWLNLGISHANLNQYDEAANAYVKALHLNPQGKHMWGYLRVVFTCMNDLDAVELCGREDLTAVAKKLGLDLE